MADAPSKTSNRARWFKFGRFISAITIACFFLPFFGVSCEGMEVITISGADMVGGCKPGGLLADAADQKSKRMGDAPGDSDMKGDIKIDKVPREPLAIVALGLALVVFGLSWMRTKGAMTAAAAVSVACIGALIGLWLKVGGDMKGDVDKALKKDAGSGLGEKMMKETKVDAGSRFGLYLTVFGLLGTAALAGRASRDPDDQPS
jgi:hypothetical protein